LILIELIDSKRDSMRNARYGYMEADVPFYRFFDLVSNQTLVL
jgi:hypothetical protein